jgi:putative acetyltransferase
MDYIFTDRHSEGFIALCGELDDFLNEAAGGEVNRRQHIPLNALDGIQDVILACDGPLAVGCAALRPYDGETAEVKRVFVRRAYRGRGISRQLMERLERRGTERGYRRFILETGEVLTAATHLYRSLGYVVIPNYGPYIDMPDSMCMEKQV